VRLPPSLAALAERRFRLLFAGRIISAFGTPMAEVALAFAVLDLGGPSDLGLVILAREIPTVRRLRARSEGVYTEASQRSTAA
jgi:hypothetical protein